MIVPNRQACSNLLSKAAKVLTHTLAQRLESLEARAMAACVKANALGTAVIDRHEHGGGSLSGPGGGHVGAPQGVDRLRNDCAVVVAWTAW